MLFEILAWLPRRRLRRSVAKKLGSLEGTIQTIRIEKQRAEKNGATTLVVLHNTTLYLLSLHVDHTILVSNLALEKNKLKRSVYSRQLASLYYEFFDDFPNVLGAKIKDIVGVLPRGDSHKSALELIQNGLRTYRKSHEREFYRIRNIIAAHKDLDGELQFSTIESIDHDKIQDLAVELEVWFQQIWQFIADAVSDYSSSPVMIRDVMIKVEEDAAAHPK